MDTPSKSLADDIYCLYYSMMRHDYELSNWDIALLIFLGMAVLALIIWTPAEKKEK